MFTPAILIAAAAPLTLLGVVVYFFLQWKKEKGILAEEQKQ
jgi:hypothetical protein